jgi:hypothetical protein
MLRRTFRIGLAVTIFGAGYLLGGVTHPAPAEAQVGELGKKALEQAAGSGGTLGSVAKLGTTITDMEDSVSKLQKEIDTLKEIKAALGGG